MLASSDSLPVLIDPSTADYMEGIFELRGLLRYQDQTLILEYKPVTMEEYTLAKNPAKSLIETRSIPLKNIRTILLKSSIFGTRITLEANSLTTFNDISGSSSDQLVLRIPRKNRKTAEHFAAFLNAELAEIKLGASGGR